MSKPIVFVESTLWFQTDYSLFTKRNHNIYFEFSKKKSSRSNDKKFIAYSESFDIMIILQKLLCTVCNRDTVISDYYQRDLLIFSRFDCGTYKVERKRNTFLQSKRNCFWCCDANRRNRLKKSYYNICHDNVIRRFDNEYFVALNVWKITKYQAKRTPLEITRRNKMGQQYTVLWHVHVKDVWLIMLINDFTHFSLSIRYNMLE